MAAGYNIALAVAAGVWTPTLKKSAAGVLTFPADGTAITLPWVENSNSGTGDTTTKAPYTAVIASLRGLLNDRAANGDPV